MKTKLTIPTTLFRSATFERDSVNEDERTVKMTISSDAPYERYFGKEILDHSPGSIKMDRLRQGAPLLFNHDRNQHLGRITDVSTDGKKLSIVAKFGNSPLANEKFQDVKDGILRETSVGYQVNAMKLEEESKEGDTYRVTDWTPHEGSLVTIPADISCGVGRDSNGAETKEIVLEAKKGIDSNANQLQQRDMPDAPASAETTPKIDVVAERKAALAEHREKCKKIDDWTCALKNEAWRKAAEAVALKHKNSDEPDFDAFRSEALNGFESVTKVEVSGDIGMSKKDLKRYSLARAILARGMGRALDGLEKECSDATAKILRKEADGFYIPEDWNSRSLGEMHDLNRSQQEAQLDFMRAMTRTLTAGSFAGGGALIGTDLMSGSFIDLLRNKSLVLTLGPTMLSGLVGNVAIPKQTGGATAYWLAEGGSVTASDQAFAQLGLTPKRLVAQTAYDKQLLAQASLSVEGIVRNDQARVTAIAKDLAALFGTGVAGQPIGIANTTGIDASVTFSGAATWANVVKFETAVATANADIGPMSYLTTPATRGKWKTTVKVASYPVFLWSDNNSPVNGYPANVTNQVTGDRVFFGVWSELIVADWAGIDVVVNPFSLDSTGQIRTTMTQFTDNATRHPAAFSVSTDSGAQ